MFTALRTFLESWKTVLKAVAVAIAALWTVFAYYGSVQDARVRSALEYRRELRSEPLFEQWQQATIVNLASSNEKAKAAKAGGATWRQFVIRLASAGESRKALDTVLSFYDEVWRCVQTDICDRQTVLELFGAESQVLHDNYIVFIACERAIHKDIEYGEGLVSLFVEYFIQKHGRCPRRYLPKISDCSA